MNWFSIAGDALHIIVAVPALGIGIVIGALGYRYLLKNDPTLLNKLISDAYIELQKVAATATAKAAAAPAPAATPPSSAAQ